MSASNLSWPAVSQIYNFTFSLVYLSTQTSLVLKQAPIVDYSSPLKVPLINLAKIEDLPTLESPINTTFLASLGYCVIWFNIIIY